MSQPTIKNSWMIHIIVGLLGILEVCGGWILKSYISKIDNNESRIVVLEINDAKRQIEQENLKESIGRLWQRTGRR